MICSTDGVIPCAAALPECHELGVILVSGLACEAALRLYCSGVCVRCASCALALCAPELATD